MNSQNTQTSVNFGHAVNRKLRHRPPQDRLEKHKSQLILCELKSWGFHFISANVVW